MILLLLGTNPYSFTRLLHAVNQWALDNEQHVIAQTGHTPTESVSIECHDFVDHKQIVEWIDESEFVITQGGFGSIKDCINMNKKVLVAPRLQELGECQDSQKELVDALADENRIVALYDMQQLPEAINKLKKFNVSTYESSKIPDLVSNLIDDIVNGNRV